MIDMDRQISDHLQAVEGIRALIPQITEIGACMLDCLRRGGKVIWMGNGGSAADSQHLAAEFVGRYTRERQGLASIALTTDTSILTAVGNDYGYESIFSRQIDALCTSDDVVVGISTSGNSRNIIVAMEVARARDATTVAFGGRDGGELHAQVDHSLIVPSWETARIQEGHILIGHLLCDMVESGITDSD